MTSPLINQEDRGAWETLRFRIQDNFNLDLSFFSLMDVLFVFHGFCAESVSFPCTAEKVRGDFVFLEENGSLGKISKLLEAPMDTSLKNVYQVKCEMCGSVVSKKLAFLCLPSSGTSK